MIELETPPQSDERRKNPRRIVVAALAAAAAVIAIVLFAVRGNESPSPADQTAPTVPATGAPLTATQTTGPPAMSDRYRAALGFIPCLPLGQSFD